MTISSQTTIQAYQLRAGGSRARLAILRRIAADSTRLAPGDWKSARHTTLSAYPGHYGLLSGGRNNGDPVWYSYAGEEFRNERDANDVNSRIDHTGWFTDAYQDETAVGIVVGISHGRFLSGYRWTSNDERVYFPEVCSDEIDAARAADGHAERFAESEREGSELFCRMQDVETAVNDALSALGDIRALRRCGRRTTGDVIDAIETLRDTRTELIVATKYYENGGR